MYVLYGLPMAPSTSEEITKEIDEEILKVQTDLISEKDFQKLQNTYDNQFVNANSNLEGIAENLAKYYMLYGDINLINSEIELYHSITREEIREVAKKYLNPNQRLILDYVPSTEKAQN
jgi:predicted Zn-dependent peptidase